MTGSSVNDSQSEPRRLGRRQLGLHAYEERMPKRIHALLSQNATVTYGIPGLIRVIAQTLEKDPSIKSAYLCHPDVQFIGRIKDGIFGEGFNFCGYHNIQMLLSYLAHVKATTYDALRDGVPSILKLQDYIEQAWDKGINSRARIETGGIRGTRKYIGTLEVQALFQSLGIHAQANAFQSREDGVKAIDQLLKHVDDYFHAALGIGDDATSKVTCTTLPPIYLQRPGHSMTIVGIMKTIDDTPSLLVFDPGLTPPASLRTQDQNVMNSKYLNLFFKHFRRGSCELKRFSGFETLQLNMD